MATGLPPNWDFSINRPAEPERTPTSDPKARDVYVVMRGDMIEGVYTDFARARDRCTELAKRQFEDALATSQRFKFHGGYQTAQIVWPTVKRAVGMFVG